MSRELAILLEVQHKSCVSLGEWFFTCNEQEGDSIIFQVLLPGLATSRLTRTSEFSTGFDAIYFISCTERRKAPSYYCL